MTDNVVTLPVIRIERNGSEAFPFEDEMTERHAVRSEHEYRIVTQAEAHEEAIAQAKALGDALTGLAYAALHAEGDEEGAPSLLPQHRQPEPVSDPYKLDTTQEND